MKPSRANPYAFVEDILGSIYVSIHDVFTFVTPHFGFLSV